VVSRNGKGTGNEKNGLFGGEQCQHGKGQGEKEAKGKDTEADQLVRESKISGWVGAHVEPNLISTRREYRAS